MPDAASPSDEQLDRLVDSLLRISEGDFAHRVPRTNRQDTYDIVAYCVNLITDEFEAALAERDRRARETEERVQDLCEALVGIATGDFERRATRSGSGEPLDVLAFMVNNTAVEVGNLVRGMVDARMKAQLASHAKDVFLANMSHELRTPMNAVLGYTELLLEEVEELDRPDLIGDLRRIRTAGTHLLQLISDVLDISKISSGHLELHPVRVDLRALVDQVEDTLRIQADAKGIDLTCTFDPTVCVVYGDDVRIRQVLTNLLSNAVKFTLAGEIRLDISRAGEHGVRMQVTDTGIGMAQEQLERIFQPFVQVDADTTRRFGGTGLGLSIVHELCSMMGGEVTVESTLGEGTRFVVVLPLGPVPRLPAS